MIHFIVPLYNNGKSSIDSISRVDSFLRTNLSKPYEIILCDDGSIDDTLFAAKEYALSNPRVKVIGYKENRGRGYALKFAGSICSGDYIIYIDSDFPKTTRLEKLMEMVEYLKENEIVIGSRFSPGSIIKRFPLRAFVSRVYRCLVYLILPELKINDIDIGFKGFKTECFKEINVFSQIDRWSWDLEFLCIARRKKARIKEFPIDWNEMYDGYSTSINIFKDSLEELCGILSMRMRSFKELKK